MCWWTGFDIGNCIITHLKKICVKTIPKMAKTIDWLFNLHLDNIITNCLATLFSSPCPPPLKVVDCNSALEILAIMIQSSTTIECWGHALSPGVIFHMRFKPEPHLQMGVKSLVTMWENWMGVVSISMSLRPLIQLLSYCYLQRLAVSILHDSSAKFLLLKYFI